MIREGKNKFWLTLILILSLSFSAFAFGIANVFAKRKSELDVKALNENIQTQDSGDLSVAKWVMDDGTEKSSLGILEGGSTFKIEKKTTTTFQGEEVSDIIGTKKVDETKNVNYISNYTITINGTKYSPVPNNGYKVVGFNLCNDKGTEIENVKSGDYSSEDIDPAYTGKITVKAVCEPIVYKAYLYYSTDGKTWKEKEETFTVGDTWEDLDKIDVPSGEETNVQKFSCWAINTTEYGNVEFCYTNAEGKNVSPVKIDSVDLYKVSKIKGFSSVINNFKIADFEEKEGNFSEYDPTIRATWSYVYNGLIDNKASNTIDETKVAAFAVGDTDSNNKKATLKFSANVDEYNFGFFKNEGSAFETTANNLKGDAFGASGKYGVYNYGYEVSGWNIYFSHGENDTYRPIYNGSWSGFVTSTGNIDINTLSTAKMCGLADKLDALFIEGYDNRTITFEPVWQEVKINIDAYDEEGDLLQEDISTLTYGRTYVLNDDGLNAVEGKTLYYYVTTKSLLESDENKRIIARHSSGSELPWNYVNIPQGDFDGDGYDASKKTYTLNVTPVYVDNIHKINLSDDADHSNILYKSVSGSNYTYTLKNTDAEGTDRNNQYKFAVASGINSSNYKITSPELGLGYNDFSGGSTGSIEAYIINVVTPVKTDYETKITDGSLSILRKVFTENSGATLAAVEGVENLSCTTGLSNEQFYIYLANNKKSGELPVFIRDYYDLIAWDNSSTTHSFITTVYDEEKHKDDFGSNVILDINNPSDTENYWTYSKFKVAGWQAHYFRKTYLLDLNTLRDEKAEEGRYGYIYINIVDRTVTVESDKKSAQIIAVYDNNTKEMQYFDVSSGYVDVNSISGKTALTETSPLLRVKTDGEEKILCVLLYAGCDVTIKASCVDWFNGDDLRYQDMVGYHLKSITTTNDATGKTALFTDVNYATISNKTAGTHSVVKTAAEIEENNYPTNTKIVVNANFAPIDYTISVTLKSATATGLMANPFAGRVDCSKLNTTTEDTTITFTGNVENWSQLIEYIANAGYTLRTEAITTLDKDNVKHILLSYDLTQGVGDVIDSDVDMLDGREDIINKQEYAFDLDGKWLIENYYTSTYDATVEIKDGDNVLTPAQTLAVDVNTELLTFTYNVEIIDNDGNLLSTYENGIVQLDGSNLASNIALTTINNRKNGLDLGDLNADVTGYQYDKFSVALVANEFEQINDTEDFYVVKILKCTETHSHTNDCYKNYVILESSLSQIVGGNNYKRIYNFLLKQADLLTSGTDDDVLTQATMNSIYGTGEIVNLENRFLTMQIKVAELYTITLKAQAHEKSDPGLIAGDRTTTIKNHVGGSGELTNIVTLTTKGNDFTNSVVVYTYKGVRNHLSSVYNEKMYQGVTYKLGGSSSNIEGTEFTLDPTKVDENGNRDLIVTYVPKPITAFNVEYVLNGQDKSYSEVSSIIKEITKPASVELYYNEYTYYEYELLSQDYIVTTTLNGAVVDTNPILCIANENAFNAEGFYIVVKLQEVDKQAAQFRFLLEDADKAFADDNFGAFEVLVGGNVVDLTAGSNGWYSVNIPEGRTVQVDLTNLAKGYKFVKLNRVAATLTTDIDENNIVNVTNSFSFADSNIYSIIIDKEVIKATLSTSGSYKNKYNMSTTGITTNVVSDGVKTINAYLGKTITFTSVDEDREKLDYYYYVDASGNEHEIEEKDGVIQLKITTELLDVLGEKVEGVYNLNIGIKTINKYNLKYKVYNSVYAENVSVTLEDATEYINGTNMLSGTKLLLSIISKDNKLDTDEITILEAKYDIKLSGCKIEGVDGRVITNGEEVSITTGKIDGVIVLDADKVLTITISPKSYKDASSNSEGIYSTITEYNNLTPTANTESIGNFVMPTDMYYGSVVTVKFDRVNPDVVKGGELAVVRLKGNDSNELIIHINGKQIVSIYDKTANVEYVVDTANAKHSTETDVTTTNVVNLTEVLQGYGYNLSFVTTTTDRVEITFEVKNKIEISTEYLCYKTIKPII